VEGPGCELGFVGGWEGPAGEGAGCWARGDVGVSSCYARMMSYVCIFEVWCLVAMR
jgi:hypothetical protein